MHSKTIGLSVCEWYYICVCFMVYPIPLLHFLSYSMEKQRQMELILCISLLLLEVSILLPTQVVQVLCSCKCFTLYLSLLN